MQLVRYCPICDDEFRPEIKICSDCGGDLVLQPEGAGKGGAATSSSDGTGASAPLGQWRTALDTLPVSSLVPARTLDSLNDLEPAVAAFADIELPSRVLVQNGRYILLIHPDTLAQAQTALHAAFVDADDAPDTSFDTASGRYSNCPACGTRLAESFTGSCPECGLELSAPGGSIRVPEAE